MGVFISWSGKSTKSHRVAEALRDWLRLVVQGCEPWTSSLDIDAGERWGSELFNQLDKHGVGIICVTKENAPVWLKSFKKEAYSLNFLLVFARPRGQEIKQHLQIRYLNNRIQLCYAIKGLFCGGRRCRCL